MLNILKYWFTPSQTLIRFTTETNLLSNLIFSNLIFLKYGKMLCSYNFCNCLNFLNKLYIHLVYNYEKILKTFHIFFEKKKN